MRTRTIGDRSPSTSPTPLASRLAEFAGSVDTLPDPLLALAARIVRHNLTVALAARPMVIPGTPLENWPPGLPAVASATHWANGEKIPSERAVFANSLLMGARAQHDESPRAISHFGSTVIPPLLATAETCADMDGSRLLTALAIGYQVGDLVGAGMVVGVRERGFRPTGIFGPLAGAAACAWLRGLRGDQFASALALAANMSAGLSETWRAGTDEWRYQTALAARSAFTAADLASQGVRGSLETFEAPHGFQRAYADSHHELWNARIEQRWAIEDVNLKLYPVCVFNQAAVQQVVELRTQVRGEIAEIRVRMNPADASYPGVDAVDPPPTRAAALMSVQVCAAIAALRGAVDVPDLERSGDDEVRALACRVTIENDDAVPSHGAQVSIHTDEGVWAVAGPAALRIEDATTAPVYETLGKMGNLNSLQTELLFDLPQSLPARDGTRRILEVVGARH